MTGRNESDLDRLIDLMERVKVESRTIRTILESRLSDLTKASETSTELHNRIRGHTLSVLNIAEKLTEVEHRLKKRKRKQDEDVEALQTIAFGVDQIRDWCDSEGVDVWNIAVQMQDLKIQTTGAVDSRLDDQVRDRLLAEVRYTAWALLRAGSDEAKDLYLIYRDLHVSSKTAAGLFAHGIASPAQEVIKAAATLFDALEDPRKQIKGHSARDKAIVLIEHLIARADIEIGRDNEAYAWTLFVGACERKTDDFKLQDIELIIRKACEVGYKLLVTVRAIKGDGRDSNEGETLEKMEQRDRLQNTLTSAMNWFRRGLAELEPFEINASATIDWKQMKLGLQEGLVQSSILASDYDPTQLQDAETILRSLCEEQVFSGDRRVHEFRFTLLRIMVEKGTSASDIMLVLEQIVDDIEIDENAINRLIGEIGNISRIHEKLPARIYGKLIVTLAKHEFVDAHLFLHRVLLALILSIQAIAKSDPQYSFSAVQDGLDRIGAAPGYKLNSDQAISCTTLLWKIGDRFSEGDGSGLLEQAAEWCHDALSEISSEEIQKCKRRSALCHIKSRNFSKAETILSSCDSKQAETWYLKFLLEIRQDRCRQACQAVREMGRCEDLDGTQLLLTFQVANEVADVATVIQALETILHLLRERNRTVRGVEELIILRCMIKMLVKQYKAQDNSEVYGNLNVYFKQGLRVAQNLDLEEAAVKYKEFAWLYKTSYNTSFDAIKVWEDKSGLVEMLETTIGLMSAYQAIPMVPLDPQFPLHLATANYFTLSVLIFQSRDAQVKNEKNLLLERAQERLPDTFRALQAVQHLPEANGVARDKMMSSVQIYKLEILVALETWGEIRSFFKDMSSENTTKETLQTMAALILSDSVPTEVVEMALKEMLRVVLSPEYDPDMSLHSRWIRAIVDLLIHQANGKSYDIALTYAQQAGESMERGGKTYPKDEIDWLWKTSYNLGLDLADLGERDRSRQWFEISMTLAGYASNPAAIKAQLHSQYQKILARLAK